MRWDDEEPTTWSLWLEWFIVRVLPHIDLFVSSFLLPESAMSPRRILIWSSVVFFTTADDDGRIKGLSAIFLVVSGHKPASIFVTPYGWAFTVNACFELFPFIRCSACQVPCPFRRCCTWSPSTAMPSMNSSRSRLALGAGSRWLILDDWWIIHDSWLLMTESW